MWFHHNRSSPSENPSPELRAGRIHACVTEFPVMASKTGAPQVPRRLSALKQRPVDVAEVLTVKFLLNLRTAALTNIPPASEAVGGTAGAQTSASGPRWQTG